MTTRIILTIQGEDRPGLTRALADAVMTAGGNWLESQLARLGGQYVGAVLVELQSAQVPQLEAALADMQSDGLRIAVMAAGDEPDALRLVSVEVVGQDRPGIVREVTSAHAAIGCNIEEFHSATENSAWSGEKLFRANLRLAMPDEMKVDQVRDALEGISGEIIVDLTIHKR